MAQWCSKTPTRTWLHDSGFHCCINKTFTLLGFYTVSIPEELISQEPSWSTDFLCAIYIQWPVMLTTSDMQLTLIRTTCFN
jgi:hypothetical protein